MRDLTDLDKESFERLVNDLLYADLAGKGAFIPNPTAFGVKDGGKDAEFDGAFRGTTGRWTVSVKGCGSAETLKKDLGEDFRRHTDRAWIVVTSFEPRTAPTRRGAISEEASLTAWLSKRSQIRQPSHLVTGLEVKLWLRRYPFVARSYGLVEGGGDLYFRAAGDVAGRRDRVPPPTRPRDLRDRVARALTSEHSRLVVVQGPLGLGQPDLATALVRDVFLGRAPWADGQRPIAILVDETWLASPQELNRALRAELNLSVGPYLFVVPPGPRAGELARGLWARVQDASHRVVAFLTEAQVQDQGFAHAPPRAQVLAIEPLREEPEDEEAIRWAARTASGSRCASWTDEQLVPLVWDASGRIELAVDLATDRLIDRGMWIQDHLGPLLADLDLSLEAARDALCVVALLAPVGVAGNEPEVLALDEIAGLVGCPVVALERLCGRLELWGLLQRRPWSATFVWDLDAPMLSQALLTALWRGPRRARLTERLLRHEGAVKAAHALMKMDDGFALRLVEGLYWPVRWGDLAAVSRELASLTRLDELSPRVADALARLVAVGAERVSRAPQAVDPGEVLGRPKEILRTLSALLLIASGQGADTRRSTQALFDLLALGAAADDEALTALGARWARPPGLASLATRTLASLRARITEVPLPSWLTPLAVAIATPWLQNAHTLGYATPLVGTMGAAGWDEHDEQLQEARTAAVELLVAMTGHLEPEVWSAAWRALGEIWSCPAFTAPDLPMPPAVQLLTRRVLDHAERQLSAALNWDQRRVIERAVLSLAKQKNCPPEAAASALQRFLTEPRYLAWRWMLGDWVLIADTDELARHQGAGEGSKVCPSLPLYPPASNDVEVRLAEELGAQVTTTAELTGLLQRVDGSAGSDRSLRARGLLTAWMSQSLALFREVLFGAGWRQVPRALRGALLDAAAEASALGLRELVRQEEPAFHEGVVQELFRLRHQPAESSVEDLRELFPRLWRLLDPEGRVALFLRTADHPDPSARALVAEEMEWWQGNNSPRPTRQDVARVIARLTSGPAGAAATRVLLEKLSYHVDDPDNRVATAVGLALLDHPEALRYTCSHVSHPEHPHAEARVMSAVMSAEPERWIQRVRQLPDRRASWFVAPVEPALAVLVLRRWGIGYDVEERDRETLYRLVDRADPDDTTLLVVELVQEGRVKAAAAILTLVAPSATATYAEAACAVLGVLEAADRDRMTAGIRHRLCGGWIGEVPVARWSAVAGYLDAHGQRAVGEVGDALRRLALDIERMCTLYAP